MPGSQILIPVESDCECAWPCKNKIQNFSKFRVYFWHLNIRWFYSTFCTQRI